MEGYKEHFDKKLITIWSAPNYCYRYNIINTRCKNVAAILELDEKLTTNFKRFTAAPEDFRDPPLKKPIPEYFL
jgi:serine/threonine-protein phosphatase 4 catalytic subunit